MNLGHELADVLPELQAAAESMMVETCLIQRSTGTTVDDEGREVQLDCRTFRLVEVES